MLEECKRCGADYSKSVREKGHRSASADSNCYLTLAGVGPVFLGVLNELAAGPEVPAKWCVPADPLLSTALHLHGRTGAFTNHGPLQLGKDARHLGHGPAV